MRKQKNEDSGVWGELEDGLLPVTLLYNTN